jgi:hypothetical protein
MAIEVVKINKITDTAYDGTKYSVKNLQFDTYEMKLYGTMIIGKDSKSFYLEFAGYKTDYDYLGNKKEIPKKFSTALWHFLFNHVIDKSEITTRGGKISINKIVEITKYKY